MNESKHPTEMTGGELEEYVSRLKAELEDLEEERVFVLGQTGVHLSPGAVTKYDSQMQTLRDRIAEAERLASEEKAG